MDTVTVSTKYQVVIPRAVREALGVYPGQKVQVIFNNQDFYRHRQLHWQYRTKTKSGQIMITRYHPVNYQGQGIILFTYRMLNMSPV